MSTKLAKELAGMISEANKKGTSAYDAAATVIRVEGNIAWVHIPGGVDETPARKTLNASVGDTVQVRVSGGRAWITGNASNPPTDDTAANLAYNKAETAQADAQTAQETAEGAEGQARDAAAAAEDGKKVATNYITDISSDGIMIHDKEDPTTGWKISDALQLMVSGVSHIWAGISNAVALIRIGLSHAGNIIMSGDGYVDIRNGSTVLAHFGYGEGAGDSESGTGTAPYYTIGARDENSDIGNYSVAEGRKTIASGYCSHAEGNRVQEADGTLIPVTASGNCSHAEGAGTTASGPHSHAQGVGTTASGGDSHAEGCNTTASGNCSHAEGYDTTASGHYSHAQNSHTIAASQNQTALGRYNIEDDNNLYAVIIGNGRSESDRSNAVTVDWSGNLRCSNIGQIYKSEQYVQITSAGIDTFVEGAGLFLPSGTYVIIGEWVFGTASSTGGRNIECNIANSSGVILGDARQRVFMGAGNYAILQATYVGEVSGGWVIIRGSSSNTTNAAQKTMLKAVRIA